MRADSSGTSGGGAGGGNTRPSGYGLSMHASNSNTFLSAMLEKTQLAPICESGAAPAMDSHTTSGKVLLSTAPASSSGDNNATAGGAKTAMWSEVKVIDLGSACFEGQTMYSYIQSRFCK